MGVNGPGPGGTRPGLCARGGWLWGKRAQGVDKVPRARGPSTEGVRFWVARSGLCTAVHSVVHSWE